MMSVSISQREKLLDMTVDIDQLYALYQRLVCRSIFLFKWQNILDSSNYIVSILPLP